jgi:hypothetical protein
MIVAPIMMHDYRYNYRYSYVTHIPVLPVWYAYPAVFLLRIFPGGYVPVLCVPPQKSAGRYAYQTGNTGMCVTYR